MKKYTLHSKSYTLKNAEEKEQEVVRSAQKDRFCFIETFIGFQIQLNTSNMSLLNKHPLYRLQFHYALIKLKFKVTKFESSQMPTIIAFPKITFEIEFRYFYFNFEYSSETWKQENFSKWN